MQYLRITNTQPEPYSAEQLRQDNPNTSFPKAPSDALLAEWGVYPYTMQAQPTYDYLTQSLVLKPLVEIEGSWTQGWAISNLPLESASDNIRSRRNKLLSETDWMALSDNVMSPAWREYRLSLRSITSQEGFPFSIAWPTKPE